MAERRSGNESTEKKAGVGISSSRKSRFSSRRSWAISSASSGGKIFTLSATNLTADSGMLGTKGPQPLTDLRMVDGDDRSSEQRGVDGTGFSDGERANRHASGHLDDR